MNREKAVETAMQLVGAILEEKGKDVTGLKAVEASLEAGEPLGEKVEVTYIMWEDKIYATVRKKDEDDWTAEIPIEPPPPTIHNKEWLTWWLSWSEEEGRYLYDPSLGEEE